MSGNLTLEKVSVSGASRSTVPDHRRPVIYQKIDLTLLFGTETRVTLTGLRGKFHSNTGLFKFEQQSTREIEKALARKEIAPNQQGLMKEIQAQVLKHFKESSSLTPFADPKPEAVLSIAELSN